MNAAKTSSFRGVPAVVLALALAASAAWLDESGVGRRWQAGMRRAYASLALQGARWAVDQSTDAAVAFARAAAWVVPGLRHSEPEPDSEPEQCSKTQTATWPRG